MKFKSFSFSILNNDCLASNSTNGSLADNMRLYDLVSGQNALIVRVHGDNVRHERLRDLGFRPGQKLTMLRKIPYSGFVVEVGQGFYALRSDEAGLIEVSPL